MKKAEAHKILKENLKIEGFEWKKKKGDFQSIFLIQSDEFKQTELSLFVDRRSGDVVLGNAFHGSLHFRDLEKLRAEVAKGSEYFNVQHPIIFNGVKPWDMTGYELDHPETYKKRVDLLKGMKGCRTESDVMRAVSYYYECLEELVSRTSQINSYVDAYNHIEGFSDEWLSNWNKDHYLVLRTFLRAKTGAPDYEEMASFVRELFEYFYKDPTDSINSERNNEKLQQFNSMIPCFDQWHLEAKASKKYNHLNFKNFEGRVPKPELWK